MGQVLILWKSEPSRNGADSSMKTLPWRLVGRWSSCGTPSSAWGLNLFPFLCDNAAKYGDFKSPQESQNLFFFMFSNGKHSLCECSRQDLCSGGTWGDILLWGCLGGVLGECFPTVEGTGRDGDTRLQWRGR